MATASLFTIMDKNKSDARLSMGYEAKDYLKIVTEYLKNATGAESIPGENGNLVGSYIPGLNGFADSGFDMSSINFTETGFSTDGDTDKRLAKLTFFPWRAFVALKKDEDKYTLIRTKESDDNRFVIGYSSCGRYVSPPISLDSEIVEAGKSNSEGGSYRVGVGIDSSGMLKSYFEHFYPNEPIGKGLKDGSISTNQLEKLIAERCLYAEVSFGGISKTAFFSVTDSYKMGNGNELNLYIDAPLCVTSALSSAFNVKLDNNLEPVNLSSKYDFKKGLMDNCSATKYAEYSSKNSKETTTCNITLNKKSFLGVRFFCLEEKKSSVESVIGVMPDDFYKTNVKFSEDMSSAVTYSGVEFVSGEVEEARKKFYDIRGSVPKEMLDKLQSAYREFKSHSTEYYFYHQFKSTAGLKVGDNCGYFTIPEGYPMALGNGEISNMVAQIVKDKTTRSSSSYSDSRIVSGNGIAPALQRGYSDEVYHDIASKATGVLCIRCNKYIGPLLTLFFQTILNYYGKENLPKIAPSLCVLSCVFRTAESGHCHKRGTAIDLDYQNNFQGRNQYIKDGENTNYKGFLEIVKASGCKWPVRMDLRRKARKKNPNIKPDYHWDYMHFQWE